MRDPRELLQTLSALAIEDPAKARRVLRETIATDTKSVSALIGLLEGPTHGRLRHLVANVARNHDRRDIFVPTLLRWREKETDEFTRRAIAAALVGVDEQGATKVAAPQPPPFSIFEVYNDVAGRLRHRLSNTLFGAQGQLARLKKIHQARNDQEAEVAFVQLNDSFTKLARALEAIDVDPPHFEVRSINIAGWLIELNTRYPKMALTLLGSRAATVWASDYLLDLIFTNIWMNTLQNEAGISETTITFREFENMVRLQISDSGAGFPEDLRDVAFEVKFSTKSANRGRGLMEIKSAIDQLGGNIALIGPDGDLRIQLDLPRPHE